MKRQLSLGVLTLMISAAAMAQPGWKWPEDIEKAKENNALYTDALKSKEFETAIPPHKWLLENAPDLNKSLYLNGAKIYEGLATKEADATKKTTLQDKALEMYDLRMKYFGDEANVMNRKAPVAYKYYRGNKAKYKELLNLFDKTFQLNGQNTLDGNLLAYMDIIRRYKLTIGDITDEQILERHGRISDALELKINKGKNVSRLESYQEKIDEMLTKIVTVDCDFVEQNLGSKLKETNDVKIAKNIVNFMITGRCTDSPLFLDAAKVLLDQEPDFGLAKVIALKLGSAGDIAAAHTYYDKAIEYADEDLKKAEIYMSKAKLYNTSGKKALARTQARKALAIDPSMKEAYTMIGNLYMSSAAECQKKVNRVEDRLMYIAAYNQYKKAGNSKMMERAKEQFPSIGEIFELGHKEGQVMTCDCWINESVKLQRRP